MRDEKPEVLRQLATYREFLKEKKNVELVTKAYRTAATLMVELRAMADSLGEVYALGGDILAAASASELGVDCEPRLVVLNQRSANQTAWAVHAEKLGQVDVVMTVVEEAGPFVLRRPA